MNLPARTANMIARTLDEAWRMLRPPPRLTVWEWAEKFRKLPKEVTARPGRYRTDTAPYQREPQEVLTDQNVSTVVMQWASRLGKSEVMMNLQGYTVCHNPRNILVVYPTKESAEKWSKQFFAPMIRYTPELKRLIAPARSRDSGNTIFNKEFPGGTIGVIGANSASAFRQIQAPVIICDEIDTYGDTSEGDPVTLAFKRAENYPDSIQVLASTPTYKNASRIESWYEKSDQRKWHVQCTHCRGWQVLAWNQVLWETGKPESACIVCSICQAKLTDEERVAAVMGGQWRATAPFRGIAGFWLNGLNSPFPPKKGFANKLHQFAAEFLEAKSQGSEALKVWTNTFLAETWQDESDKVDPLGLMSRAEKYGPEIPDGCWMLLAGVDVQLDRLEAEIVGYGEGEETWAIEFRQFFGNPERDAVWNDLDAWLSAPRRHVNGAEMRVAACAVDCGYKTKRVLEFCKARQSRRIWAVKGTSTAGAPLVARPKVHSTGRIQIFAVGTDAAKEQLFSRVMLTEPGPRYCHFKIGHGYDEEWFRQLTAEEVVTWKKNGFIQRVWKKVRARNEALDIRVYISAVYEVLQPAMKKIREQVERNADISRASDEWKGKVYSLNPDLKNAPAANQTPPQAAPAKLDVPQVAKPVARPFVRPSGGGFVTGGRRW